MQQIKAEISGTSPLMMHNGQLVNPLNEIVKAMKEITSKPKKTDDDYMQLYRLEFLGGLYYDPKIGPYIPDNNIFAAIRDGARYKRKGAAVERGLVVSKPKHPLEYTGNRVASEMFDLGFADIRNAKPKGASGQVMRCRPIFNPPWRLSFTLLFDPSQMSADDLRLWTTEAGQMGGLGDGRKIGMGRFVIEKWEAS